MVVGETGIGSDIGVLGSAGRTGGKNYDEPTGAYRRTLGRYRCSTIADGGWIVYSRAGDIETKQIPMVCAFVAETGLGIENADRKISIDKRDGL